MQWFLNLSTRSKLFVGFGLMILFLATPIVAAHAAMADIKLAST